MPRLAPQSRRARNASGPYAEGRKDFDPAVVIVDPFSALMASGSGNQTAFMALRLVDYLKSQGVTALFLDLQNSDAASELHISSIMDTWIWVRNKRSDTELSRRLHIIKARAWRIRTKSGE